MEEGGGGYQPFKRKYCREFFILEDFDSNKSFLVQTAINLLCRTSLQLIQERNGTQNQRSRTVERTWNLWSMVCTHKGSNNRNETL